jgi:hypothetical protein
MTGLALLAIPVVGIVGAWAHELTHALAAVALGGTVVRIDLWQLVVEFQGVGERRAALVRWMPALIGCLLALLMPLVPGRWLPAALLWWASYTLLGGDGEPGLPAVLHRLRRGRTS